MGELGKPFQHKENSLNMGIVRKGGGWFRLRPNVWMQFFFKELFIWSTLKGFYLVGFPKRIFFSLGKITKGWGEEGSSGPVKVFEARFRILS